MNFDVDEKKGVQPFEASILIKIVVLITLPKTNIAEKGIPIGHHHLQVLC